MTTTAGPPPVAPQGWQVSWSDQHTQWYYVNQASGASQWEPPTGPAYGNHPGAGAQPAYHAQNQQASPQQSTSLPGGDAQAAGAASTDKAGMNPKMQTALAVGGGMAAGAFLGHEIHEFTEKPFFNHGHQDHHHHNILGSMAGLIGSAGAGALGARLFGKKAQTTTQTQTTVWSSPQPQTPTPPAQGYPSHNSGPGWGTYAAGGAAGVATAYAVNAASHHNQYQTQQPQQNQYQNHQGSVSYAAPAAGVGAVMPYKAPTPSGPPLIIHAATYADLDITEKLRRMVTSDQRIVIEKLFDAFGDPWPEAERKMFNVLYQYGERPLEVLAVSTAEGKVEIRNEALSNDRMAFINKTPGRIIALIWGKESVLSEARVEKLEKEGDLDCKELGNGGFWAWEQRNLVCYYRAPSGGIAIGNAREGGTIRLPWNPLAKWS